MSIFSKIEKTKVPSNTFDLTHDKKLSAKMGKLTPTLVMDLVPGDKVTLSSDIMIRFAPLIAPVMHQVSAYMHYFFVPNRLLWDNWEDFITGGENGMDMSVPPYLRYIPGNNNFLVGSLYDYMGLPTSVGPLGDSTQLEVNALPFAAYNLIYNDYYRDQNLQQTELEYKLQDGDNSSNFVISLQNRAWQHDYFTSGLPWTQKGPEATIPLGTKAPLKWTDDGSAIQVFRTASTNGAPVESDGFVTGATGQLFSNNSPGGDGFASIDLQDSHYADLSDATAATIIDLRRAFKLQEWLEKNARGGSRYIESIAAHFGVLSSDKRLQRPEFIGGFRAPIKISEVLQTSGSPEADGYTTTPQGNMAGHAIGIGGGQKLSYYAEEHGYIIGIMSVLPKTAYQQGVPKHFLRKDRFDYYWPEFAHIGEQPILNQEIFIDDQEDLNETFAYTPRYAEYKYIPSTVHGDFRTNLSFWHMGRIFQSKPYLNSDFIQMDYQEVDRIFAVEDNSDHLWCHVLNNVKADRKMPYFGNPKM